MEDIKLKIYLHFEDDGSEYTESMWISDDDDSTTEAILSNFAIAFNKKKARKEGPLDPNFLRLRDGNDRLIPASTRLFTIVHHKDDIFVKLSNRPLSLESTLIHDNIKDQFPEVKESSIPDVPTTQIPEIKAIPDVPTPKAAKNSSDETDYLSLQKCAQEYYSRKSYKKAREVCGTILSTINSNDYFSLELLTNINLNIKRFTKALKYAKEALNSNKESIQAYLLAGNAYKGLKQYSDAISEYNRGIGLLGGLQNGLNKHKLRTFDFIAAKAQCLFELGQHQEAAESLNIHMSIPQMDEHVSVLLAYAHFALMYDKVGDALRALLKCVVVDQSNDDVRRMLARVFKTPQGVSELIQQVPPTAQSVSAYAFLAIIAKDHSALDAAAEIFRATIATSPRNISVALNLVHVLEVKNDQQGALSELKAFLHRNMSSKDMIGLICNDLYLILSKPFSEYETKGVTIEWDVTGTGTGTESSSIDNDNNGFIRVVIPTDQENSSSTSHTDGAPLTPSESSSFVFDERGLDMLAMGFTAVKILFLQGELPVLPHLFRVIEKTRRRSAKPLHETLIRNEHAYYICITRVLAVRCNTNANANGALSNPLSPSSSLPSIDNTTATTDTSTDTDTSNVPPPTPPSPPIFVCGDSHCLSSSWNTVEVRGRRRLLVPRLVTGLKHWHLRLESDFYPKANFHHVMASIPEGAEVIFIFGEIDCREGLLVAVERDKYGNILEGIEHTVGIFCSVLTSLIEKKKIKVYIHPVLPVLKETKPIVMMYNEVYQAKVKEIPGVQWLNFLPSLLDSQSGNIREDLYLDGTHIHPKYLVHMESTLSLQGI
eukprot:gene1238-2405_t